ncbi:hypothetical protein SAMN05216215_1003221 [Saccharopolyspora shandongensis]|uniref:Uncharacterized protein n=1 Tax=Saccharopolyspora shandongensis TaxID=418495 RepID=A0A1H2TTT7_9PSEU|nr:hypothetical protein [Saccharopolyspora shandongensis]SDW47285.1 hypothetical protein SAMN05216215_1003221 [Saccharopolyspora shandongensis]
MTTERHRFPVYLAGITGLALIAIALLCWATGIPNPLAVADDPFGRSLLFLPQPAAHLVLAAVGALTLVAAVRGRGRIAGVVAVGALALLLDSGVLAAIGYLPFMAFSALTGHVDRLGIYLSPSLLVQVGIAAAAASLLWVQVSRATASAAAQDPAAVHERAVARTRRWTKIAMEAPLVYAATRVLMALQAPGFDLPMERDAVLAGLGLALAATGGAALTWGLIRPWGERFPRWIPGAAGRPVPVDLAVVPALTVSVLVLAASKVILTVLFAETGIGLEYVLVWLPMLLWPLWSVALALAAVNYKIRRSTGQRSAMMV